MNPSSELESLRPYALTGRQLEKLTALIRANGDTEAAANSLGVEPHTLRAFLSKLRKAAAEAPAPAGTSTLYDGDGNVKLRWVKSQADRASKLEAVREGIKALTEDIAPAKPAKQPVTPLLSSMFTLYPEGDPHWGMRVWGDEADGPYNLDIAYKEYCAAVDWLIDNAPDTEVGIALNVGDNFHVDCPENVTRRSKNTLHVDGRLGQIFRLVVKARRYKLARMLEKHKKVVVREVTGNHDEVLTMGFTETLKGYYHDEPRISIEDTPSYFWYYQFGKVLLGATHGDKTKIPALPLLMAVDNPAAWGATVHRHIYTGHMHHLERWEEPGVVVEMLRTLAARNEYEHSNGYRAGRDMMYRVFHADYGEVVTQRIGIELVRAILNDEV